MAASLLIDLAVPVEGTPPPDERVRAGLLPAGDYVTLLFRGHYDGLVAANAAVQQWGEQHGVRWAMDSPTAWRARIGAISHRPARRTGPGPVGNRDRISHRGPAGEVVARLVRHGEDLRIASPLRLTRVRPHRRPSTPCSERSSRGAAVGRDGLPTGPESRRPSAANRCTGGRAMCAVASGRSPTGSRADVGWAMCRRSLLDRADDRRCVIGRSFVSRRNVI
mgnify:CR=1 FL=1